MQVLKVPPKIVKLIAELDPIYGQYSEMTSSERYFLSAIIQKYKPKKLLELGIAAGSSSVLILNAIKNVKNSYLMSVDYSTRYYRDTTKDTGFIVDKYPYLKKRWTLYTGGLASRFMDKIGYDIDFCFIDTKHSLPGEILDFLLILPYLKTNAILVIHDTNLQTWGYWPQCVSNNLLISAISGEKIVPYSFEKKFYHSTLKREFQMYFPNITGVILDNNQRDRVWDIFNLLTQKWEYIPSQEDIGLIRKSFRKHYSRYYTRLFESILSYQLKTYNK